MISTYDDHSARAYLEAVALGLRSPDFQTQLEPGMPRAKSNPAENMNAVVGLMDARRALDELRRLNAWQHAHLVTWLRDPDEPQVNLNEAYEGLTQAILIMNGGLR